MTDYSPAPDFSNLQSSFSENGFQPDIEQGPPQQFADDQPQANDQDLVNDQGEAEQPSETQAPRKKKNANPFNKRIDRLTAEKGELEQHSYFLAQQLAERDAMISQQREILMAKEQELASKTKYANSAFEQNLTNIENSLVERIEQAELEGDIRKKTELSRDLAKVVAQQSTYELYKSQQAQQQQEQLYNEPYVPYETPIIPPTPPRRAPVNDDFIEWQETNSWYGSDQALTKEADDISDDLARRLRFNNQAHMIGSAEFMQSISNIMRDRYGMGGEAQEDYSEPAQAYNTPSRNPVAPVQRRGTTMADQYVNRGNSQQGRMSPLTREEYNLARYLPQKTKTETEADLIRRYEKGKNYPKSPHPGGSPYRLTIL